MSTEWPLRPAANDRSCRSPYRDGSDCTYTTSAGTSHRKRGRPMPAKKPAKKPAKNAKKTPPPRVPILPEEKLTPEQRALLELDPLRTARQLDQHPRAVRGLPARTRLRRAGADSSAATAATRPRCRRGCPNSPFWSPRSCGGRSTNGTPTFRRPSAPASSLQTIRDLHAGRAAEVGAQGRARDLRFHPGALQDPARERPEPTSASTPSLATPPPSSWSASSAIT